MLFTKGASSLSPQKVVAIIGTRNNTAYGAKVTELLIEELSGMPNLAIVSGLAAGIDGIAHKAALKNNIPTIGVLGHGHDLMYPASHKKLANDMLSQGAVISEYLPYTKPEITNFPMRNRIVAGMADITIVVESKIKGGAIITAKLACGYNRTLGAVPGNIFDNVSKGCNQLLVDQLAIPITSGADIINAMNWAKVPHKPKQTILFEDVSEGESQIIKLLKQDASIHTDDLMLQLNMGYSQFANLLLQMELKGMIESLPGKRIAIKNN